MKKLLILILTLFLAGCSADVVDYSDDIIDLKAEIVDLKSEIGNEVIVEDDIVCDNTVLLTSIKKVNDELERYNKYYQLDYRKSKS